MTAHAADTSTMSPECGLAQQPGYEDLHDECRQTEDIPLPHGDGVLVPRCSCPHHRNSSTE